MIIVERKKKGVTVSNIWYATQPYKKVGVHYYHEALSPFGSDVTPFRTFVSDLTLPEEEIIAKYSKNTRYKIRKADREGITGEVIMGEDVTQEDVQTFCTFFHKFWESKGRPEMTEEVIHKQIVDYVKAKKFCITKAIYEGETLVYHTYIQGEDIVRQFHSASLFRTDEKVNPSFIGMANCYLHQVDMLTFKEKGIFTFDWGGAGETEEVASITEFKAAFGGEVKNYYNGTEIIGFWPKLATAMMEAMHKN